MASPLSQFEIKKLYPIEFLGYDISFTNSSLFMVFAISAVFLLFTLGLSKKSIIPNRMQMLSEMSYNFILRDLMDGGIQLFDYAEGFINLPSYQST